MSPLSALKYLLLFPATALAGVNTFSDPPKSLNIISTGSFTSTAPAISFYAPMFETGLEDPHAVVGHEPPQSHPVAPGQTSCAHRLYEAVAHRSQSEQSHCA